MFWNDPLESIDKQGKKAKILIPETCPSSIARFGILIRALGVPRYSGGIKRGNYFRKSKKVFRHVNFG